MASKHPARFGVRFSDFVIRDTLRTGFRIPDGLTVTEGLPADATIIGVSREADRGTVTLWFSSPSGCPVEDGALLPIRDIEITRDYANASGG